MQNDPCQLEFLLYLQVGGSFAFLGGTLAEEHDLVAVPYAGATRFLADEDRAALSQLAPDEVQDWCLSRIAHYRNDNALLREEYGGAARNAISKNKSHIRALRTIYNDAAPIHRHLPPEVLMKIFSHVDPDVTLIPRPWVPMLPICRYWRRLLLRTAQFWANLLSLPIWTYTILRRHMQGFRTAIARSGHESLALSVPYYSQRIVDILTPHASRLLSFDAGPTLLVDPEEMSHNQIEQYLLCVSHYPVHGNVNTWRSSPLAFSFTLFPNLRLLKLQHTRFYHPAVQYLSLCHLQLDHCALRPSSATDHVPAMCATLDTLELFPNLETLSLTCCLSEKHPDTASGMLPAPRPTKTIHLPRLRRLELEDVCSLISLFLSHLVFPPTTALALCATHPNDSTVPLFAGADLTPPPPHAALHLAIRGLFGHIYHPCYETRGENVRPVRITLSDTVSLAPRTIAHFARELVTTLAPARGITSLAMLGMTYTQIGSYWDALRGFISSVMESLVLEWRLPNSTDCRPNGDWRALEVPDDGRDLEPDTFELLSLFRQLCDTLRACLGARRSELGGRPLRRLEVTVIQSTVAYNVPDRNEVLLKEWQVALAGERMREKLGDLVEDIVTVCAPSYE